MATGNISGGGRNYARPTSPTTATLSASTSISGVSYSLTASTLGPAATSYVIAGTSNDGGATTSVVVTGTTGTATGFDASKTYNLSIAGQNYNGAGATTASTVITIPSQYVLVATANATTSYTIPSSITKAAALIVSTGGVGAIGGARNTSNQSGGGGGGGGTGAIVAFWDFAVTSGSTVTLTVGSANAATKVTYGGVDIATANQGSAGNAGSDNDGLIAGTGGSGGNAITNVSTNFITRNGVTGGNGGPGVSSPTTGNSGTLPTVGNAASSVSTASFAFAPTSNETIIVGSGGGGGGGRRGTDFNNNANGQTGAAGGTNGGTGGSGAGNSAGNAGTAASNIGSGGGGGCGSGVKNDGGNVFQPTNGGSGGAARIYFYTA